MVAFGKPGIAAFALFAASCAAPPKSVSEEQLDPELPTTMPKVPQVDIPPHLPRARLYDIDKDGALKGAELYGAPSSMIALNLAYGVSWNVGDEHANQELMLPDQAYQVFSSLSSFKAARVLDELPGSDDQWKTELFTRLFREQPEKALAVILASKELYFEQLLSLGAQPAEGFAAHMHLRRLPVKERRQLLELVAQADPAYKLNLDKWESTFGNQVTARSPRPDIQVSTGPPTSVGYKWLERYSHDLAEVPEVMQREYIISDKHTHAFVQTFGAGPCVVVTLFDRETGTGAMAHFDALTDVNISLDLMCQEFGLRGIDPQKLEARVLGGQQKVSNDLVAKILNYIHHEDMNLVQLLAPRHGAAVSAVMMNLETGKVSAYEELLHREEDRISEVIERVESRRVRRVYRHPESLPSVGIPTNEEIRAPVQSHRGGFGKPILLDPFQSKLLQNNVDSSQLLDEPRKGSSKGVKRTSGRF